MWLMKHDVDSREMMTKPRDKRMMIVEVKFEDNAMEQSNQAEDFRSEALLIHFAQMIREDESDAVISNALQ